MNPFDLPPTGSPVSVDAPQPAAGPRRGRMALVAVLTVGLIGGGIAGISQLAAADRPDLAAQATEEPTDTVPPADETVPPADETVPPADATDDGSGDETESPSEPDQPVLDGELVFDTGDGDPIVIDLGDADSDTLDRLSECIGFPRFDFDLDVGTGDWEPGEFSLDLDEFFDGLPFDLEQLDTGDFGVFDAHGSVTVAGPDGVSVVDLGDNGSVTVTKDGDDVTIRTDGDATVSELSDVFGDLGTIFERDAGPFGDEAVDEFLESLPAFDELPDIEPIDPAAVQSCVDEVLGR